MHGVIEIGGTHVTTGLVDPGGQAHGLTRRPLDPHASADELLGVFAHDAATVVDASSRWVVAIPGPFDYARGIGEFHGVGKFTSLDGVDVRAGLLERLPAVDELAFVNDADAYGVGEWDARGRPAGRALYIALGTGIGSCFIDDGRPVADSPGIPEDGRLHLLQWQGRPIEETVSRRAIRARFTQASGEDLDVREIAERMRGGDPVAATVLHEAFSALGEAVAPVVEAFGASELVVGGSMAKSWDLIEPALAEGLRRGGADGIRLAVACGGEEAPLVGALLAAR